MAEFVDDRGRVVLLLLSREFFSLIEDDGLLVTFAAAFPRLGDRGDKLYAAASLDDSLGGLAVFVEFPVAGGDFIRRIENRLLEEQVFHATLRASDPAPL